MKIRFMSFNIQHGFNYVTKDGIDLKSVAGTIRELGADVVGLNEVRYGGDDPEYFEQARRIAEHVGWKNVYFAKALNFPDGGAYGNALISRFPIKSAETVKIPDPPLHDEDVYYETRCLLRARFEEAGGFTVLVTHFGLARSEACSAAETVARAARETGGPVILMGDFNLAPDSGILAPVREIFRDTADLFEKPLLSWPSDRPRVRIDYIFCSGRARPVFADIPRTGTSDHRPYVADIEL